MRRDDGGYQGGQPHRLTGDDALALTQPWHVGDGGYFDNPGAVAAMRWIEVIRERIPERPILFIQINPFPAAPDREPPEEGQGWKASLLGPLTGMLKVRTSSQLARSDFELSMIGDCFEAVEFRPPYVPNREDPPLSWELSRADRQRIATDWRDDGNRDTVSYLRQSYFNGRVSGCRR